MQVVRAEHPGGMSRPQMTARTEMEPESEQASEGAHERAMWLCMHAESSKVKS